MFKQTLILLLSVSLLFGGVVGLQVKVDIKHYQAISGNLLDATNEQLIIGTQNKDTLYAVDREIIESVKYKDKIIDLEKLKSVKLPGYNKRDFKKCVKVDLEWIDKQLVKSVLDGSWKKQYEKYYTMPLNDVFKKSDFISSYNSGYIDGIITIACIVEKSKYTYSKLHIWVFNNGKKPFSFNVFSDQLSYVADGKIYYVDKQKDALLGWDVINPGTYAYAGTDKPLLIYTALINNIDYIMFKIGSLNYDFKITKNTNNTPENL